MKAIEKKILAILSKPPETPIKGRGNVRHEISGPQYEYLCELAHADRHGGSAHFCTVFARRSTKAKYNRMQFGADEYFISTELKKLFVRCVKSLRKLEPF